MGIDIGGATIVTSGTGIALNALVFNANGQGSAFSIPGYQAVKASSNGLYYAGVSGWEFNTAQWQSGLNTSNGVFTCPVAGLYAMGYNGLHRGGSGLQGATYGYSCWARNGAMSYHTHWNMGDGSGGYWNTGGTSALYSCQAGDTLAMFVNRAPSPLSPDGIAQNLGIHPDGFSHAWCRLVG